MVTNHPRQKLAWELATEQGYALCALIDDTDFPEFLPLNALEFLESVRKDCEAVLVTIEQAQHVTEKQLAALANWRRAVNNLLC